MDDPPGLPAHSIMHDWWSAPRPCTMRARARWCSRPREASSPISHPELLRRPFCHAKRVGLRMLECLRTRLGSANSASYPRLVARRSKLELGRAGRSELDSGWGLFVDSG
eukprot:scaffold13896_cov120-Isochrysis_galbana.AAC.4